MLVLTPDGAKSVLYASEGTGEGPGHTLARHVNISKEALRTRGLEFVPRGEISVVTAFMDIHQCAQLLSLVIGSLRPDPFVNNFANIADGEKKDFVRVRTQLAVPIRYCWGTQKGPTTDLFDLTVVKMKGRPFSLHVVTFYPRLEG